MSKDLIEIWVACGTKFGKTFGASAGMGIRSMTIHNGLLRWVAPIYAQTKIGFKYGRKILPPEPYTKVDNHDLSLTVKGLDTRWEFKSGKYPEDLEGEGVHGYVLDECAKMQEQVYDSAKTTTAVTRGPIMAISTPRGRNWFYTKCMDAKEEMEWSIKKGIAPQKLYVTAPSIDNPMVSAAAVEDARKSMPERLFRQYYMAEFVDDGTVFTGFRKCLEGPNMTFPGDHYQWFDPDYSGEIVVLGADWAKTHDYTVFTAFGIESKKLVGFQRFHKTPYTEAIRRLVIFSKKFDDVIIARHDKTGLGGVIDDQLSYTDLPYEGVTFTNSSKSEMVAMLITSIEHGSIRLPMWEDMIAELDAYEVAVTAIGNMTYSAPSGKHDDIVSSLLLSHSALVQYSDSGMDLSYLDTTNKSNGSSDTINTNGIDALGPVERFYKDLTEDYE